MMLNELSVIELLIEVEERRLDLRSACSSLYDFCMRRLGLSDSAAQRRMTVARMAKRFPCLLGHLESGKIHLSTLAVLRDYLTAENVEAVGGGGIEEEPAGGRSAHRRRCVWSERVGEANEARAAIAGSVAGTIASDGDSRAADAAWRRAVGGRCATLCASRDAQRRGRCQARSRARSDAACESIGRRGGGPRARARGAHREAGEASFREDEPSAEQASAREARDGHHRGCAARSSSAMRSSARSSTTRTAAATHAAFSRSTTGMPAPSAAARKRRTSASSAVLHNRLHAEDDFGSRPRAAPESTFASEGRRRKHLKPRTPGSSPRSVAS